MVRLAARDGRGLRLDARGPLPLVPARLPALDIPARQSRGRALRRGAWRARPAAPPPHRGPRRSARALRGCAGAGWRRRGRRAARPHGAAPQHRGAIHGGSPALLAAAVEQRHAGASGRPGRGARSGPGHHRPAHARRPPAMAAAAAVVRPRAHDRLLGAADPRVEQNRRRGRRRADAAAGGARGGDLRRALRAPAPRPVPPRLAGIPDDPAGARPGHSRGGVLSHDVPPRLAGQVPAHRDPVCARRAQPARPPSRRSSRRAWRSSTRFRAWPIWSARRRLPAPTTRPPISRSRSGRPPRSPAIRSRRRWKSTGATAGSSAASRSTSPRISARAQRSEERSCGWDVAEEVSPFFAEERRVLHAGRAICVGGSPGAIAGSIVVHAVLDYENLPFTSSRTPYVQVLQTTDPLRTSGQAGEDVEYAVYGWSRTPFYSSRGPAWPLDDAVFARVEQSRDPAWARLRRGPQAFDVYLLNDRGGIYALGFPTVTAFGHFFNVAELTVIAALTYVLLLGARAVFATGGTAAGHRPVAPARDSGQLLPQAVPRLRRRRLRAGGAARARHPQLRRRRDAGERRSGGPADRGDGDAGGQRPGGAQRTAAGLGGQRQPDGVGVAPHRPGRQHLRRGAARGHERAQPVRVGSAAHPRQRRRLPRAGASPRGLRGRARADRRLRVPARGGASDRPYDRGHPDRAAHLAAARNRRADRRARPSRAARGPAVHPRRRRARLHHGRADCRPGEPADARDGPHRPRRLQRPSSRPRHPTSCAAWSRTSTAWRPSCSGSGPSSSAPTGSRRGRRWRARSRTRSRTR